MIQKLLVLLIHFGPKTKRWFWRVWYNIFARKTYSHDFFFMNYRFSDENLFVEIAPEKEQDAQFLITGVLGPGSNDHGSNEFLHVPYAKKLTACVSYVLSKFSA